MSRALRWCLLVSLVLHLLAVLVADPVLVRIEDLMRADDQRAVVIP